MLSLWGTIGGLFMGSRFIPEEVSAKPNPKTLDTAEKYHQESKHSPLNIFTRIREPQPPLFKKYPASAKFKLPQDFKWTGISVEEAIVKRRSKRNFAQKPLSLKELSCLLYYAGGITDTRSGLRAAPSAGALYPIEIYPVIHQVEGIKPGIYHYSIEDHSLELLKTGDYREKLSEYCLGQETAGRSAVAFIITAIFARTKWKYQHRAYRYVLIEAGGIAENIYLSAELMGLGACALGAFFDDQINKELNIDGIKEAAIHIMVVGKKEIGSREYSL